MAARLEIEIVDRSPQGPAPGQGGLPGAGGQQGQQAGQGSGWNAPTPGWQLPQPLDLTGAGVGARDAALDQARFDRRTPWARDAEMEEQARKARDSATGAAELGFGRLASFFNNQAQARENDAELDPSKKKTGWAAASPYIGMAQAVSGMVGDAGNAVGGMARTAGGIGSSIAQNNGAGALFQGLDAATSALSAIPVVGQAVAGVFGAIVSVGKGVYEVFTSLVDRGKQLEEYSAPIAMASAQAEIRSLFADLKEANEMGEEYAKLIELQSEASIIWREALLPMKKMMAEWFIENKEEIKALVKACADALIVIASALPEISRAIGVGLGGQSGVVEAAIRASGVPRELLRIAQNTEKKEDGTDTTENLYRVLEGGRGLGTRPGMQRVDGGLGLGGGLSGDGQ